MTEILLTDIFNSKDAMVKASEKFKEKDTFENGKTKSFQLQTIHCTKSLDIQYCFSTTVCMRKIFKCFVN